MRHVPAAGSAGSVLFLVLALFLVGLLPPAPAAAEKPPERMKAGTFAGLALRGIGPAVSSGRIGDIAVVPGRPYAWFVAVASGGVWRTDNAGTTWEAVFDTAGSYSIGCVTVDPGNPLTVWVGTGENNSQRSVGYGDGVYKSTDGGSGWTRMGLEHSEHIGRIVVDPRDSDVVYVAAQGPLWSEGGDRGLYKTADGGKTWERILDIDSWTGVSDLVLDPRNPDVMYASAYQRGRRVWSLVDGGPGSAIYKTVDGGAHWDKLTTGLPHADLGRIGLAVSPVDPDVVYAIVEASDKKDAGFYRSTDAGGNWKRMSGYLSSSPQYYQELVPDPADPDRVYSLDTHLMVTEDGGATFTRVNGRFKHVDNHAMWIDPADTDHLLVGCDGGVYETRDRGASWEFKANLPVTQFYKIAVDDSKPFYFVYGGTQDNNTLGGPSRTATVHGIVNSDWFRTVGGDGFQSAIDPVDPDIVYSQWQHGGLIRYDRKNGQETGIKPEAAPGDPPLRWNWNAPLIISPHSHTRLYFGAQRLFRSDDRGDSWTAVSPDLTRQLDRNRMKVMGRVWSVDAVAKNASTSFYGTLVALDESPLVEGLLYVGTDDGLIQVTEDGGATWRKCDRFPGVPELAYVSRVTASRNDANTVYAAFDAHKLGDFKPYLLKSTDRGRSWKSIAGDLPARGTVYALVQDGEKPALLFAGTEFGVFFTVDGGRRWVELTGGMPTIAVRDLAIQRRENDLVVGTFGRGFYILDDYTPLRGVDDAALEREAALLPVKDAPMYVPATPFGGEEKGSQGDAFFTAPNPPFGAVFTYYLRDEIQTRREQRREREKELEKAGKPAYYPPWDSLRAEDREEAPEAVLTVTDADGNVVRRVTGPVKAGYHRVAWDLRYPAANPVNLHPPDNPWYEPPRGPLAAPGTYSVSLALLRDGKPEPLGEARTFRAEPAEASTLPAPDREALLAFQRKTARLQRAVLGSVKSLAEAKERLEYLRKALEETPEADRGLMDRTRDLERRLADLSIRFSGDPTIESRHEPVPPSVTDRVSQIVDSQWMSTSAVTATSEANYAAAADAFGTALEDLRTLIETDLRALEADAEAAGAPWTPGRVPTWKRE